MTPFVDPRGCAAKIVDVHGAAGAAWLERLPQLMADVAARWSVTILPPFPELSYNYVAPAAAADGTPLVIKAGVPHPELWSEIDALRAFDGRGAARLLAADAERGVLLLERVLPGDALRTVGDDEAAVAALAGVLRRLWRPVPANHAFRTMTSLAAGLDKLRRTFGGGYGPFPAARVDRATALFRELTGGAAEATLIHGDANPGNILRSRRDGWLAIDPKGYAGHPLYDVATFLNDPPDGLSPSELWQLQDRRVALLSAALGAGREEILAWAEAHAVLSGWWSYEDHGRGWEPAFAQAAVYEALGRA